MRKLRIGLIGLMVGLAVTACSDNNYPPTYNETPATAQAQQGSGITNNDVLTAGAGAVAGYMLANRNNQANQYHPQDYGGRSYPAVHKTVVVNKVVNVYHKPKRASYFKRSYSSTRSYSTSRSSRRR